MATKAGKEISMTEQYFCNNFSEDAWCYITTHFFGQKYIAQRSGLTVKALRTKINESRDARALNDILFYAGAKIDVSIVDELFVNKCSDICPGSYRYINQRMSIKTLVNLCNDFTGGGDICEGAIYRCIELLDSHFVFIHYAYETHIIEIQRNWVHFHKLQDILTQQTCNLQVEGGLSHLSMLIISDFIKDVSNVETPQEYYSLIERLNKLAIHFENTRQEF